MHAYKRSATGLKYCFRGMVSYGKGNLQYTPKYACTTKIPSIQLQTLLFKIKFIGVTPAILPCMFILHTHVLCMITNIKGDGT